MPHAAIASAANARANGRTTILLPGVNEAQFTPCAIAALLANYRQHIAGIRTPMFGSQHRGAESLGERQSASPSAPTKLDIARRIVAAMTSASTMPSGRRLWVNVTAVCTASRRSGLNRGTEPEAERGDDADARGLDAHGSIIRPGAPGRRRRWLRWRRRSEHDGRLRAWRAGRWIRDVLLVARHRDGVIFGVVRVAARSDSQRGQCESEWAHNGPPSRSARGAIHAVCHRRVACKVSATHRKHSNVDVRVASTAGRNRSASDGA